MLYTHARNLINYILQIPSVYRISIGSVSQVTIILLVLISQREITCIISFYSTAIS